MKLERIVLGYPDMDRIIVDRVKDLPKYNLDAVTSYDVRLAGLTKEEMDRILEMLMQVRQS